MKNDVITDKSRYDLKQVNRVLALLFNATYSGNAMWRYQTTCDMLTRGALACAKNGDVNMGEEAWFAAAIRILIMESINGFDGWNVFSPKEQTQIVKMFLPVANALIDWVNAIRKRESLEQECDWHEIFFMPETPEYIVSYKLGDTESRPTEEHIRSLLFKENERSETVYNSLFFKQINHWLQIDGDSIDYDEPSLSMDIQECNDIISALYEDRIKHGAQRDEKVLSLAEKSFQEILEDLSNQNDEALKRGQEEQIGQVLEMPDQLGARIPSMSDKLKQKDDVMYDVFISHAHANKKTIVNSLVKSLRKLNIDVWYDVDKIEWGDNIKEQIEEGLKTCRFGIVVISPEFLNREWTEIELNTLFQMQNECGETKVLPLLYNLTIEEMKKSYPFLKNSLAKSIKSKKDVNGIVLEFATILIKHLKNKLTT